MTEKSRFRQMTTELRACLTNEPDCLYLMHTSIGIINVINWGYVTSGFVTVTGVDEDKKTRFIVFSEEQMCSFHLEVKRKKMHAKNSTLGFTQPDESTSKKKA
jgi:hypothetical protein